MKTEAQKQTQKAIVCAYLRYRWVRSRFHKAQEEYNDSPNRLNLDDVFSETSILCEAKNCLESLKRVLWHNNWD